MSSRAFHRVTVIKGGPSAEREVSLASAAEVSKALRAQGYNVTDVDAGPDLVAELCKSKPDVVYNSLHGRWGEDGCVQGLLEWQQIPYTHSGVFASALAMDKEKSKDVFRAAGLPVMDSRLVPKKDVMAAHPMQPPYVIKPFNEGSSVGVYLVEETAEGTAKLNDDMPDLVMVEAFAPGRELTTTVMGGRALGVTDIITDGWYDYDAKYKAGGSRHVLPANVPSEITKACLDYAVLAHNALGCRGLTRTDFRWDESKGIEGLIILEVNTQPGLTSTSLAPEQAEYAGISFGALVSWITEDASCQR